MERDPRANHGAPPAPSTSKRRRTLALLVFFCCLPICLCGGGFLFVFDGGEPEPVSEALVTTAGLRIVAALTEGDADTYVGMWSVRHLCQRGYSGWRRRLPCGVRSRAAAQGAVRSLRQMADRERVGMDFRFRGVHERDGELVARVLGDGVGGFNFYDFVIGIDEQGQSRIVDVRPLISGEFVSATIARIENMSSANLEAAATLQGYGEVEDWNGLLGAYQRLTPAQQRLPAVQLIRLRAVLSLGPDDPRYVPVLEEATQVASNSDAVHMLALDPNVIQQRWDAALANIDAMATSYPDTHWTALRASVLRQAGRYAEALPIAEQALREDPNSPLAAEVLCVCYAQAARVDDARRLLGVLERQFSIPPSAMRVAYPDIFNRPEYAGR